MVQKNTYFWWQNGLDPEVLKNFLHIIPWLHVAREWVESSLKVKNGSLGPQSELVKKRSPLLVGAASSLIRSLLLLTTGHSSCVWCRSDNGPSFSPPAASFLSFGAIIFVLSNCKTCKTSKIYLQNFVHCAKTTLAQQQSRRHVVQKFKFCWQVQKWPSTRRAFIRFCPPSSVKITVLWHNSNGHCLVLGLSNDHLYWLLPGPKKVSGPHNDQIVWLLSGPGHCLVLLHWAPQPFNGRCECSDKEWLFYCF